MTDDPRAPTGQADLHVGDGALSGFAGRLDEIEIGLRDSGLTPDSVARLAMAESHFGAAIPAVSQLSGRYEAVRTRLEEFVRTRQEAMEALAIVTLLSERGYEAVEDEQLRRLQQIMGGWESRYATQQAAATTTSQGGVGGGVGLTL
ncbi:hypothetical protein E1265_20040 [Streptomyces sp. 8K308]|uniref:hypothetical protein n=1 Tax=Streptomyces sp. 8K308 TaxID=2530388 RepID=UPI001051194F|nr:hypothetical protein [Streptomyces sp. 8K308]TDC20854.1 hypothetical protein E1265_20040 [Streptomyces sp. 8K308]